MLINKYEQINVFKHFDLQKQKNLKVKNIKMGVPGFYSWLTKRYPLIKHMVGKHSLPQIDYLYLDMNGIIYKCVKDDSIIFKSQIKPKQFEQIWVQVFNYINSIVNLLKPTKMIFLALDGVAPRSKMNNQRSRRFKSARDYKQFIERFYGYNEQSADSQENFKNNSISPGTKFMEQLNQMIHFFIQKKIEEDDYWKNLSVVFTGSDCPGEGQHKIMQWIRTNKHQFSPNDCHCLYGADADLIMLGLSLPMKNICIIREQYIHSGDKVKIKDSKKQKIIQFEMIFLTILRQYFDLQYRQIKDQLKNIEYSVTRIIKDFVFLFFFIGNDFLPRCMAYNIRQKSIQKLIAAFKTFLVDAQDYVVGQKQINIKQLSRLCTQIAKYQSTFIEQKAEQAQKFLNKKVQFQDEFTKAMSQKVMKQSQFLNQLKQFYMNQDQNIRSGFYKDKFKVDPAVNIEEFYTILGFYLHGLKFVFQYYFLNLSSWSWYYPYYYAPLLSDLSFYLNYLAESGAKLNQLQLGQPFQPFKQLLCILPKQSCDLLPESFHKYLKDPQSALRSPFDYYPDHFEDDLYGSVRSHEAVSLIPFLNQQTIKRVYDEAIQHVVPQDIRRNQFKKTRIYEYDQKSNQIFVKSPLNVIQSFSCNISIRQIDLLKQISWSHKSVQINEPEDVIKMPTLYMKQSQAFIEDDKRSLRFLIEITEAEDKQIKLGNHVYYGFPLQHSGRVQAILTKEGFQNNPDFNPINYKLDQMSKDYAEAWMIQKRKKELFQDLIDSFRKRQYSFLTLKNVQALVFVIDTQYFNRSLSGAFERVYTLENDIKTYEVIPLALVSKNKKYATTKSDFRFKSLEQQFPLNQQVILAHPDKTLCGSKGKVIGYKNDKVNVKITQRIKKIKNDKLDKIVNTDEVFLQLRFVAQIIGMKPDIALTILDTVSIQLPRQKNLPQSIDIGLNFISRYDSKLVPNLVRINYGKDHVFNEDPKKSFKYLQLSIKAFQMLLQYKKKYPEVLQFITARHHKLVQQAKANQKPINWRQRIKAQDIYREDGKSQGRHQQITKNLMKVYLWLIKNMETHMPMSSIYSKQISYKKISKLQQYFKTQGKSKKKLNNKPKNNEEQQIVVDPNFLYSLPLSRIGFPYLSQRPQDHAIGDQIVCLHPQHFGHFGIVIGVDDDKYEVIFEKPAFGKVDLGGLCTNLWGGKFRFKELLNIDFWPKYFRERQNSKKILQNSGWIDCMKAFYPKFKSNPISNFNDFELIIKNESIAKLFEQSTIDYVRKFRTQLKQVQVDKQYVIVDNAKQDYHFKFDKKQTTVTQQQVNQLAKNKKWIQKDINTIKNQDFQKQIIQNKMANLKLQQAPSTTVAQVKPVQTATKEAVKPQTVQVKAEFKAQQIKKVQANNNVAKVDGNKKQKYVQKKQEKKYVQKVQKVQQKAKQKDVSEQFGEEEDANDILG